MNNAPIGSVVAFAGQANPVSGSPNNIWKSMGCPSSDYQTQPVNQDMPLNHLEPAGWILCDGRDLNPEAYPELFAVIGFLDGRTGDHFLIPDCRGLFIRGVDAGSGMDPDASTRIGPMGKGNSSGIGSLQCDALETHSHTYKSVVLAAASQQGNAAGQSSGEVQTSEPASPARTSQETRSKNIALNYIIRYR